ncbi:hypothetical protein ACNQF7_15810, partial [Flavobacterium sp. RSP29]|uniref:hypothetical protein n=1 Tax=Flavobacterium sp. RSP29 TaxID=3401731 RepID=UPI003AAB45C6
MKKFIFYTIKSVQEYWHTFTWRFNAGFSSFFWTNAFAKKLFFYVTLLLLVFGQAPIYGQLVGSGAVKANFGVDADAYANFIGFSISDPLINVPPPPGPSNGFMNTDDWFQKLTGSPISWPGSGRGVIDQTSFGILASDPSGTLPHDLGNIMNNILANSNFSFQKRQSEPPLTVVNTNGVDYLWIDSVYGRDYNVVGIQGDAADKSWFTSGSDKNADNPLSWTLGVGSGGPQKDDIIDAMAHLRGEVPKPPTLADPRPFTTLWAFGAASLRSTSGSKHIDFEFFRTLAAIEGNKFVNTGGDGGRTAFTFYAGDDPLTPLITELPGQVNIAGSILVSIDYEGGGTKPGVEIRVWMEESVFNNFNNSLTNRPFNVVPGTFVKGTDSGNFGYAKIDQKTGDVTTNIFGRVNVEGSTLASPWGTLEGEGADHEAEYLTLQHVEIGINLTAFGLDKKGGEGPCANILGSLLVKTRSSAGSLTSEQKDFVGPFPFGNTETPPTITPEDLTVCANAANNQTFDLDERIDVTGAGTITFYPTAGDRTAGTNAISAASTPSKDAYPVLAGVPKTIYVRGSTSLLGCFSDAQFTITVNPPSTANAGGPNTVCQSATPSAITLTGASVGGGATTGAWSIVSGGGTLSSTVQTATPATVTYTPAANFTGTVTLRLTTNAVAPCAAVTADRTINVSAASTVNAGGPDTVCQSATPSAITLTGASIGSGATTGAWSIVSGGGTLSSTAQTATPATVTYTPAANFTGTVTLRLTTNAVAPCAAATADRTINVSSASAANAGGPNTVCTSATPSAITLTGASVGGGATTGAWSIVSGGGTLSSTAQTATPATVTYTPAANFTGTVTLRLTTNAVAPCAAATADRTINVGSASTVNAGGSNTVCQSATPSAITLTGASVGGGATTGAWSIVSGGGTLSSTAQTA